jgi:hypothetical protein
LAYVVRFSPRALGEIEEYRQYIIDHSHDAIAANAWVSAILDAASTLENLPKRCPHIPEQASFDLDLFHCLFKVIDPGLKGCVENIKKRVQEQLKTHIYALRKRLSH